MSILQILYLGLGLTFVEYAYQFLFTGPFRYPGRRPRAWQVDGKGRCWIWDGAWRLEHASTLKPGDRWRSAGAMPEPRG
jgi:hypothetical protein